MLEERLMHHLAQLAAFPPTPRLFTLGMLPMPGGFRRRRVDVYLPLGYGRSLTMRHPVLYMWDGQNLFDPRRAFAGSWFVGAAVDLLVAAGEVPPMIIVGIDHGGPDRLSELSPWPDERYQARGEGDAFLAFVSKTVKPTVDRLLRTHRGAEYTAVAGSSMGGLMTLYAHLKEPEIFGRAAAFSPSVHFAQGALLDFVRTQRPAEGTRLYLDIGGQESGKTSPLTAQAVRDLDVVLTSQGWKAPDYRWRFDPRGTHSEACWVGRFPEAMRHLWGDRP